ncbi:MAG: PHP domain-containing protein, partial [Candidatus Delongbacteria bacterium]|nr:PHP domain-containing protein [Candidatus Delongbacteria bacterium]
MKIDLHIHTEFSDGLNSKEEIIEMAIKLNLDVIAFTDHDVLNTDYLNADRIKVITGIELSCKSSDDY